MSQHAKVKICGIKNEQTIAVLSQLPVDYVGFLFAESKRKVTAEEAAKLIQSLKKLASEGSAEGLLKTVGVFVNPSIAELDEVLARCPLDVIQLHGNESAQFCSEVRGRYGIKVFKVFSVRRDADDAKLTDQFEPYAEVIDTLMLDTHDPVYGGGSGVPFNWSVIPEVSQWCKELGIPLIVAGGLHAGNVSELIEQYAPDGVDVSSGVETDGEKDENKIRQFVGRVKP